MEFPEQIETDRLILKRPYPATFKLAQEIYTVVDKSRDTLQEWLSWVDLTHSAEDEYTNYLINWCRKHWETEQGYDYLIYEKSGNNLMGIIGVWKIVKQDKSCEIGYWLANDAVGHGYMQEAIKVLQAEIFKRGFNRIVIKNDTTNIRSVKVTEKIGYHLDGVMRQDCWDAFHNRFRDTYIWSLLKSEWEEKLFKRQE